VQGVVENLFRSKNSPEYQLISGAPLYRQYLHPRNTKPDDKIVKADTLVLHKETTILIDYTISGITQENVQQAKSQTGVLASGGESTKIQQVQSRYEIPSNVQFIPFALEVTGAFGQHARKFLKSFVSSIPCPSDQGGTDSSELASYHSQLLRRYQELITAAVHGRNASLLHNYLCKASAARNALSAET
jgi:hypothetical protein